MGGSCSSASSVHVIPQPQQVACLPGANTCACGIRFAGRCAFQNAGLVTTRAMACVPSPGCS